MIENILKVAGTCLAAAFRLPSLRSLPILQRPRGLFTTLLTTAFIATWQIEAKADGIFSGAQSAMTCIIKNASKGGGVTNAIITSLPSIIFTAIALIIFVYFLGSSFQLVQAIRAGEEASQLAIPILAAMIAVVVIIMFQNILFGSGGPC